MLLSTVREPLPIPAEERGAEALVGGTGGGTILSPPLWEGVTRLARAADRASIQDAILTLMEGLGLVGPHLLLYDKRAETLELAAHRGVPWQLASRMGEPGDPALAPFIAWRRQTAVPTQGLGETVSILLPDGLYHQAAALQGEGRLLGVLGWFRGNTNADSHLERLSELSGVFSAALLRVLRGAHQRKRTSQRDAVRRAALVVGEARDLPSVLRAICDRARLLTGAEQVAIRKSGPEQIPGGRWIVSGNCEGSAPTPPERWPHMVPIRFQGRQLAEIRLRSSAEEERPTEDDLQLTALLAGHVAALLDAASAKSQLLLEIAERRRTESWLGTVLEHSPVATLLLSHDENGPRASSNRRAKELLGTEAEGPMERILPLLFTSAGKPFEDDQNPLARVLHGERLQMLEAVVRRVEGDPTPVMVHGEPIVAHDGQRGGAVIALENISTFKTLERMREQWTSLVTHDLRQPVTSILGFSSLLAEQEDVSDSIRSKVGHIRSAARRLARISSDLLDASRMDANQLTIEKKRVDICSLIEGLVEEISSEGSDHPIRMEAEDGIPPIYLDPIRLEQVLENLLSNARKYGTLGSEVILRVERSSHEVLVHVENEGQGLEPGDLGRMFTRFFRGSGAARSNKPGMGLGLYISKGLVEAHGGRIWATSIRGKAVVFSLALPLEPG